MGTRLGAAEDAPMLQKLRTRHPIDLPIEGFGRKRGILAVLGGIAVVFVLIPLALSPLFALSDAARRVSVTIAGGVGALLLALIVGGVRGKFGWNR